MSERTADNWLHHFWTQAVGTPDYVKADWQEFERSIEREKRNATQSIRYALATFRALDRYTFEDSDHGMLIAEAVKKLEEANSYVR